MVSSILIAEHCPRVRALLRHALADDGYDVRTAESGRAALAQIGQTLPHVVLLDAELPDVDGVDVLLQVKSDERTCDVSFIMIAEDGREDKVVAALELGATDFVPKPFSKAVILARVRNVIRVRSAQERMRRARESAEAASAAKADFLASMSHDIRVPMTAILGFADLLHTEGDIAQAPRERLRAIEAIQRNGKYLLDLVNDILDISKVEAGKLDVAPVRCSPCQLVADVASLMRVRAGKKGLPLEVAFLGVIPQTIHTDPTRLRQILVNLISNAVKFTDSGRLRVVVRLEPDANDPRLIVEVNDTGIGMSDQELASVFQPYSQVVPYADREYGGTGLGLVISKRLAEMLGGSISVTSRPGEGSTFRLSIAAGSLEGVNLLENLTEAELEIERAEKEDAARRTTLNCRLLLAEDGPDNQRLISLVLRKAGAEVVVADHGEMTVHLALAAQAEGKPFAVVLMDMQMPVMDGYAATRKLRDSGYTRPIVALTAHAMTRDRQKCLDVGCDDYATKPIDRAKLLGTIARYASPSNAPPKPEVVTHPSEDAANPKSQRPDANPQVRSVILPSAADSQTGTPVNTDLVYSRLADDPDLGELVEIFIQEMPDRITGLEAQATSRNWEQLSQTAHQLRGAAGSYGFEAITPYAARLESAAKDGRQEEEILSSLDELLNLCRRVRSGVPQLPGCRTPPALRPSLPLPTKP